MDGSVTADDVFRGTKGFYDFSGSTVLHVTGVATLCAAYFLGPTGGTESKQ